jgi:hypothetical protein
VGNYFSYAHPNLLEISRGNVSLCSGVNKFGRNSDLGSGTLEDIWDTGGIYVYPTQARIHNVKSTADADDAASTGAKTVQIYGLDTNYVEINEIVTMDGQQNVATENAYLRVFRMVVRTAGAGGANAGTITATAQTDATVSAQITIGFNQTLMALYTVPANRDALMLMWYIDMNKANATNNAVDCNLVIRPINEVFQIKSHLGLISGGSSHIAHSFAIPFKIEEKSDIKLQATASAASIDVSAGFDIILVNTD